MKVNRTPEINRTPENNRARVLTEQDKTEKQEIKGMMRGREIIQDTGQQEKVNRDY
jgi:hypothetical protein